MENFYVVDCCEVESYPMDVSNIKQKRPEITIDHHSTIRQNLKIPEGTNGKQIFQRYMWVIVGLLEAFPMEIRKIEEKKYWNQHPKITIEDHSTIKQNLKNQEHQWKDNFRKSSNG